MEKQEVRPQDHHQNDNDDDNDEEKSCSDHHPMMTLNHISRVCRDVKDSIEFYSKVLGFVVMERPKVLDFEGAWLFNYGIAIHLVQSEDHHKLPSPLSADHLDPQDNHISFQCEDVEGIEEKLKENGVKYKKMKMKTEDGIEMDQIFFNDPDGFMVEVCNCENLKLLPADSPGKIKLPKDRHNPPLDTTKNNTNNNNNNK